MSLFDDFSDDDEDDDDDFDLGGEIDAGAAFTHPRTMDVIFGHKENERKILELFNSGRMPQALVFSGPLGIGKATMAYRVARFLLKQGNDDGGQGGLFGEPEETAAPTNLDMSREDPVFRQVATGAHPDVLMIERAYDEAKNRYKDSVDVQSVRKVAPFLRMTASSGGWRVVIIDDADTMNRNAQNALLKILEEPPQKVLLILVAHRSGALIPTIRSRTQMINFSPLGGDVLLQALQKHMPGITREQAAFLTSFADGSLGHALSALEQDVFGVFKSIVSIWNSWPHWNGLEIHALGDELSASGKDPAYTMFCKLMLWILASIASSKARRQKIETALNQPGFIDFAGKSSLEEFLKVCENLERHFDKVDIANLDKRQSVLGAFALIAS
ncbi:MAG: DNA polymerase III subunit delta' [Alphaproteobacteria bacterium]